MARPKGSKNKVTETFTVNEGPVIGVLNQPMVVASVTGEEYNFQILPSQTSKTIDPKELAKELSAEITIIDAHGIGLYGRTNAYVNTKGKTYGEVLQSFKDMGV